MSNDLSPIKDAMFSDGKVITSKPWILFFQKLTRLIVQESIAVGGIYISTVDTNPATLLSYGTWEAFGAGRVLVGKAAAGTFNTNGATGGEETHALSTAELASHAHSQTMYKKSGGSVSASTAKLEIDAADGNDQLLITGINTGSAGSGTAHNNLQPYIVVYMWKRTA